MKGILMNTNERKFAQTTNAVLPGQQGTPKKSLKSAPRFRRNMGPERINAVRISRGQLTTEGGILVDQ